MAQFHTRPEPNPDPPLTPAARRERDRVWVVRLRAGDERALAQIFQAYYTPLTHHAHHIVQSWDVAYDMVSDVFQVVWTRRQDFDPVDVWAYLLTATRNRAFTSETHRRIEDAAARTFIAAGVPPGTSGSPPERPDDALIAHEEARETAEHVERAYAALPPRTRQVVELWAKGLSYTEIGRALHIAAKTADAQLQRAKRILRRSSDRDR